MNPTLFREKQSDIVFIIRCVKCTKNVSDKRRVRLTTIDFVISHTNTYTGTQDG